MRSRSTESDRASAAPPAAAAASFGWLITMKGKKVKRNRINPMQQQ